MLNVVVVLLSRVVLACVVVLAVARPAGRLTTARTLVEYQSFRSSLVGVD
jgi:hypothetical protein